MDIDYCCRIWIGDSPRYMGTHTLGTGRFGAAEKGTTLTIRIRIGADASFASLASSFYFVLHSTGDWLIFDLL